MNFGVFLKWTHAKSVQKKEIKETDPDLQDLSCKAKTETHWQGQRVLNFSYTPGRRMRMVVEDLNRVKGKFMCLIKSIPSRKRSVSALGIQNEQLNTNLEEKVCYPS